VIPSTLVSARPTSAPAARPLPEKTLLEHALATDAVLLNRILHAASRHTRTAAAAEDLAQTAMINAISRSRRTGEPKPPVTPFMFVGSIMNGLGATMRRSLRRNPPPVDYDETNAEHARSASPDAHETLTEQADRVEEEQVEEQLRAFFATAGDQGRIPLAMLDLADKKDIDKNQEFAQEIGCSVEDIENAKKRIGRHGARIRNAILAGNKS
jgi:DNA-directed RNA polymerase specialized sigma24 family protein